MAYRQILYQIVFGTKHRKPTINIEFEKALYQYIYGIIKNKKCKLYRNKWDRRPHSYHVRPSSNNMFK